MPVKHPHSSAEVSPSITARLIHKFSSSLVSFKDRKHTPPEKEGSSFRHQRSLRHTTKFCYNKSTCDKDPVEPCGTCYADGIDDRRLRRLAEQSAEFKPVLDGDSTSQRRFRSRILKTVPEVDAAHVASGQSNYQARGFVGNYSGPEAKKVRLDIKSAKKEREDNPSTCSEMHRLVDSDDYLLARGANPRTGVVTPGSHSASSSIDQNQNDLPRVGRQIPSSRWRQRGDQWISLDLDEPTPLSTSLNEEPLDHQHQTLRTPQKLATRGEQNSLLNHDGGHGDHTIDPFYGTGATVQLHQYPLGTGMKVEDVQSGVGQVNMQDNKKLNRPIKRKPVGSPPGKSTAEPVSHPHRGASGSTDTVRRNPLFNSELRSSSAPHPLNEVLFRPQPVEKNPPRIPASSSDTGSQAADDSFLGVTQTDQQVDDPSSKTSNISGRHTIEKELPCLPMNNGLSRLIPDQVPYPTTPKTENGASITGSPTLSTAHPKGPRGGDLVYPYIRRPKPMYPIPPMARHINPIGERVMPIPEYDNPPKHLSQSMQMTRSEVAEQRTLRPREIRMLGRTRQGFGPLSNITTIPTDISMAASHPLRPLRMSPGHQPPDHWMMNRGQRGFRPPPPPPNGTGIIMNTTMTMSADAMMPIPMPRIRPREITRPPKPMRSEGMYGVPRIGPTSNHSASADVKARRLGMSSVVETMARENPVVPETNLMPEPLKPRQQPFQRPVPVSDVPLDRVEMITSDHGLMRKCSHCNHGFVDVKLHNTDSVTPTSALQKVLDKPNAETKSLHPRGCPLPGLPQHTAPQGNAKAQHKTTGHLHENVNVVDERDHTICCPECCKLDCHEGCLGHPSPTPASYPLDGLWPAAQSSTSPSEPETLEEARPEETQDRAKFTRLAAARPVMKTPYMEEEASKSGDHLPAALSNAAPSEWAMHPPTPILESRRVPVKRSPDAVAAALRAMEQPSQKRTQGTLTAAFNATGPSQRKVSAPRPILHRRQRSSSLPIIGTSMTSRTASANAQHQRAASGGSWLRVPTPLGFAMTCSKSGKDGTSKSRNVSGASITTIELQVPNLVSLASCGSYAAIGDLLLIPLEAGKMWVRNHPQVFTVGREMAQRGLVMSQVMTKTGWRLWAMVFVYSKTGKIKFHLSKGETVGGFVLDVGRSLLYLIVFAALSTLAVRILGLVLGLLGIVGWIVRSVFWVLKGILGAGRVK
ncbi:uncharacterized protein Z520_03681 [Fonsecaea multimorphosa CBS 102226]|uniref:Uncharacterized protein n=1 Tax=Fonsecaea multimorphosa CBS 102226 TaxID=1442371 RepID=A0A0D2KCW2_9EURO|nr:uncharacterized protein Z520_03681 [Fonsecaea multimorphosa CBS 102226]KIY01015.1 hypothetical protein Z520_03681 [Fonsecaea multimorphosa CBS 102226]